MHTQKVSITLLSLAFGQAFSMGSPKEPHTEYKQESELASDELSFLATAVYKDGAQVKVEGINVNGKAKIRNAFLRKKTATVPSNIRLRNVAKIDFTGSEGTSLVATVSYKGGTVLEYLMDGELTFGGWVEGTEKASACTLKADKLTQLIIFGPTPEPGDAKAKTKNPEAKEVLDADKNEALNKDAENKTGPDKKENSD
jgi:hypothetical protein